MKIFKTCIQSIDPEDFETIKQKGRVEITESAEEYFSSEQKAIEFLKEYLKDFDEESSILRLIITEIELDSVDSLSVTHYYNKDFHYLGFFDWDAVTVNSKYQKGDWVLFIQGYSLVCGLVAASPEGSDSGLVIYEDSNVLDCSPHDHTKEINFVSKISEDKAKELLPRKYFEGIKRRFKDH